VSERTNPRPKLTGVSISGRSPNPGKTKECRQKVSKRKQSKAKVGVQRRTALGLKKKAKAAKETTAKRRAKVMSPKKSEPPGPARRRQQALLRRAASRGISVLSLPTVPNLSPHGFEKKADFSRAFNAR